MKTIVYLILVMMICSGCVPRAYRYEQPYEEKEDSFVEINYNKPYKGEPRSINDPRFVKERMEETNRQSDKTINNQLKRNMLCVNIDQHIRTGNIRYLSRL